MSLVGIAKLAAESSVLESKTAVEYRELESRRWISRCSSKDKPFEWTINPYRGCEFACQYCYARYTHEFMDLSPTDDFETKIFAKQWSRSAFASELRRIPRTDTIAIGSATDPYQPAERRYGNTRNMLEVFAGESGRKIYLITKSDLIQRDIDLLSDIQRRNRLMIQVTVTTLDRDLARMLEPKAPRPDLRMNAVRTLAEAGITVGISMSPVLPGINDSEESLSLIAREAVAMGAQHIHANVLFLKPCSREVLFPFIEKKFPHLMTRYRAAYTDHAYLRGEYPELIQSRIRRIRTHYGLVRREEHPHQREEHQPPYKEQQLPLFAA